MNRTIKSLCLMVAVLGLGVVGTGCSKNNPTAPTPPTVSAEQANVVATQLGQQFSGTYALEYVRYLLIPRTGNAANVAGMKMSAGRATASGVLEGDNNEYVYEIHAY